MIPTIGTKGNFTFAAPYDTITNPDQIYEVMSVRALAELQASNEDPLNNIYLAAGDTEATYISDMSNNEPIVVFSTEGGSYIYIPANKVVSDTKLSGVPYVEKTLIVNLGYLPVDTDLSVAMANVTDHIYSTLGVTPVVEAMDTSGTTMVSEVKDTTLRTTRSNNATVNKSYLTQYNELLALYDAQKQFIANIESVYITNGVGV